MKWENVDADGTQMMKVWEEEGANVWPQISVLRVTNGAYLKFSRDPNAFMGFVNAHNVFSKPVIVAGPWVSLSSVDPKDASPDWVLTMVHGRESTMIVAALPLLKQEKASSKMR
jgi:hypothetical protein